MTEMNKIEDDRDFYLVRIDKKSWTKDAAPLSFWQSKGEIQKSRLHGDYDLFIEGDNVATLFANKKEAASYTFAAPN